MRIPAWSDQLRVMQSMLDAGVSTRRGIMCSHLEPAYADQPQSYELQHSAQAQQRCVLLPLFPSMTRNEQSLVAVALRTACGMDITSSVGGGIAA